MADSTRVKNFRTWVHTVKTMRMICCSLSQSRDIGTGSDTFLSVHFFHRTYVLRTVLASLYIQLVSSLHHLLPQPTTADHHADHNAGGIFPSPRFPPNCLQSFMTYGSVECKSLHCTAVNKQNMMQDSKRGKLNVRARAMHEKLIFTVPAPWLKLPNVRDPPDNFVPLIGPNSQQPPGTPEHEELKSRQLERLLMTQPPT